MDRLVLILRRVLIAVAVLPLVILVVMVLIAAQVGAIGAIIFGPESSGPFDPGYLAQDYSSRMFQITGVALAYEFYVLFVIVAFPFLLVGGDLRWW